MDKKEYDQVTTLRVTLNAEADRVLMNSKRNSCMYSNCQANPIGSHCFQKAMIKECLSDSRNIVYGSGIEGVSRWIRQGEEAFFDEGHVNQASVFNGFCRIHDTGLFKLIENQEYSKNTSLEEYVFLYSYRNLCHHIWSRETYTTIDEPIFNRFYNNPVIQNAEQILQRLKLDLNDSNLTDPYSDLKICFEKYILEDGQISNEFMDEFKIFVLNLERFEILFASLACHDSLGSKFPISMGILPKYQNKPNLYYIVAHCEDHAVFDILKDRDQLNEDFIQGMVLKSGNTLIHPNLYEKICTSGELECLKEFISWEGQIDFNRYKGFNLFQY